MVLKAILTNIYINKGSKFVGKDLTALKSIEVATRKKSVKELKEVVFENKDGTLIIIYYLVLLNDDMIAKVLNNLHNELLEKNLIKIIELNSSTE